MATIYPSTPFPALASSGVTMPALIAYLERMTAYLQENEAATIAIAGAQSLVVTYTAIPTDSEAVDQAIVDLGTFTGTGMTAQQVQTLLTYMQSAQG